MYLGRYVCLKGSVDLTLTWCNLALGEEFIEEDVDDEMEDEFESATPSKLIWHTQHCKHSLID